MLRTTLLAALLLLCLGSIGAEGDGFGTYLESAYYTATVTSAPFIDIRQDTEHVWRSSASDVDDVPYETVELGFTVPFYGHDHDTVYISPNGFITLADALFCNSYCNSEVNLYHRYIAPLMADWNPGAFTDSTVHSVIGFDAAGIPVSFTTQYTRVPVYGDAALGEFIFSVYINTDGVIRFNYKHLPCNPTEASCAPPNGQTTQIGLSDSYVTQRDPSKLPIWTTYDTLSLAFETLHSTTSVYTSAPFFSGLVAEQSAVVDVQVEFTPRPLCSTLTSCETCTGYGRQSNRTHSCIWCGSEGYCANGDIQREAVDACTSMEGAAEKIDQCTPAVTEEEILAAELTETLLAASCEAGETYDWELLAPEERCELCMELVVTLGAACFFCDNALYPLCLSTDLAAAEDACHSIGSSSLEVRDAGSCAYLTFNEEEIVVNTTDPDPVLIVDPLGWTQQQYYDVASNVSLSDGFRTTFGMAFAVTLSVDPAVYAQSAIETEAEMLTRLVIEYLSDLFYLEGLDSSMISLLNYEQLAVSSSRLATAQTTIRMSMLLHGYGDTAVNYRAVIDTLYDNFVQGTWRSNQQALVLRYAKSLYTEHKLVRIAVTLCPAGYNLWELDPDTYCAFTVAGLELSLAREDSANLPAKEIPWVQTSEGQGSIIGLCLLAMSPVFLFVCRKRVAYWRRSNRIATEGGGPETGYVTDEVEES